MSVVDAFFTAEGDSYVPGHLTRGPWGQTMGGQVVGGLLGWALDGLNLGLGQGDSWLLQGLSWILGVPSLVAALIPLAFFVASDETL